MEIIRKHHFKKNEKNNKKTINKIEIICENFRNN